jgi:hypothetical protein
VPAARGETYFVAVDGAGSGRYALAVDCIPSGPFEADCSGGEDDDGDGETDCADGDCFGTPDCPLPVFETDCADGLDDDGDGPADCDDPDCRATASCPAETACRDAVDDDGDGATDCDDPDCGPTADCTPEGCAPDLPIGCGERVSLRLGGFGATDRVDAWACPTPLEGTDGPERTFLFLPLRAGRVDIGLVAGPGAVVAVVPDRGEGCDPGACVAGGRGTVSFQAEVGVAYHLVVDAPEGAVEGFTLETAGPACRL